MVIALLLTLWLGLVVYGQIRPLPAGLSLEGPERRVPEAEFLADLTWQQNGKPVREQVIFKRLLRLIDEAERFVLLDFFLFNHAHDQGKLFPPLTEELTNRLIAKKRRSPETDIVLITDEINRGYGQAEPEHLVRLQKNGVRVIYTDTTRLRDSNFLYSAWWRLFAQWFGSGAQGWLPSPFGREGPAMTIRSYLRLFNFKANHRKVAISEKEGLITSANPHDASAYHSNIAFVVRGAILKDLLASEAAVADFSGTKLPAWEITAPAETGNIRMRLVTEGKIRERLLTALDACGPSSSVRLAMFYLSDRRVIEALLAAASRGAEVRLILDPNKDAFGRQKNGIPNRPVAGELLAKSQGRIAVRWYNTRGEQFHSKMAIIKRPDQALLLGGSANFTRRNLADLNLETNLELSAAPEAKPIREAGVYFERIWANRDGTCTLDSTAFAEDSFFRRILYRFQEWSGLSTF